MFYLLSSNFGVISVQITTGMNFSLDEGYYPSNLFFRFFEIFVERNVPIWLHFYLTYKSIVFLI